jgi:osmoprotectant transport system ATP-binding protein
LLLADRIAFMREGRLLASDTPSALVASPPDDYVRAMLESPKRQAAQVARIIAGDRDTDR